MLMHYMAICIMTAIVAVWLMYFAHRFYKSGRLDKRIFYVVMAGCGLVVLMALLKLNAIPQ